MPAPLADLVKEKNPRRRVLRLRPIKPTLALQKKLARVYLGLMRIWAQAAKEAIERYRGDRVQDAAFADKGEWVSAVMSFAQASAEQYIEGRRRGCWTNGAVILCSGTPGGWWGI